MALLSLVLPASGRMRSTLLIIGLGGASLFFGDAMITPAISVLSAVEGVEICHPSSQTVHRPTSCRHPGRSLHDPEPREAARASDGFSGRSWRFGSSCWAPRAHGTCSNIPRSWRP